MTLAEELEAQRAASLRNAPALAPLIDRLIADLRRHGTGDDVPRAGDPAPDFVLPDAHGNDVQLSTRLASGPVILVFYRGGWCPYCNLELRAYQRELGAISARGASLLAVSPQTPDSSLDTSTNNELGFDVLSDVGSGVAMRYGLAFTLPDYLRDVYRARNLALPDYNGTDDWILPVAATFVIARDGRIALAHAELDYRTRLEPAAAIAALDGLRA
ncbi:MAG: redoxin domain-containing protein [Betaproteobacteria bacterium]|nr:redoxin domain-containing protein [Betaproteobacteria bacterium]